MTAQLSYKKIITIIAATAFLLSTFFATVAAQEDTTENGTTAGIGIQVSAPIYNFQIDPGDSGQEIIKVRNVGDKAETFYPEVFDFRASGETGTPAFILDSQAETYTYSLAAWITISKQPITLKPNESTALNFTINVPKNAEPGGRYAGVLFGTAPPTAGANQVAISNKVGSLVLVRVSGDAKEEASVEEFSTPKNFYREGPVDFVARIKNTGNVHVIPKGNIDIKDTFGRKVASLPVNEKNGNVLPESIRRFDKDSSNLIWEPGGFTVGRYTATLALTYGDPAKNLTAQVTFWVVPWVQLLIIALAVIIVILLLIFLVKRYNKWVVEQAEKNQTKETPPAGT
ncbi:MAG: hypothetical protein WD187_03000 [Candidatus Woykebacteria bacterium]